MGKDENSNAEPPLDDYGIDHDRILEICEALLLQMHNAYVLEKKTLESASDFAMISSALSNIWDLTQKILDIDDVIRSAAELIQSNSEENTDKNNQSQDNEEDSEEDEDDDEKGNWGDDGDK